MADGHTLTAAERQIAAAAARSYPPNHAGQWALTPDARFLGGLMPLSVSEISSRAMHEHLEGVIA